MIKIEHNVETGKVIEIELTDQEKAEFETQYAESKVKADASKAEAEAKAAARQALLDRLGITEDEAKLLLG